MIATTENINKNKKGNIFTINLGECENKLKEHYNINKNDSLIILKLDLYEQDSSISSCNRI